MGRAFKFVILGGGNAAGYAANEFVKRGIDKGELCIISEEQVPPYERPALSKGYLMPETRVRLPSFHTCVGVGESRHTAKWYQEHGIELVLGTRVVAAQVKLNTLTTAAGETIAYNTLIVATGSRPLRLEDFGVSGVECGRICYLRDVGDADRLVEAMEACPGGKAVVIGGGYIGMEATAALVANGIQTTMVFPEPHCMARLFTREMAEWYEAEYRDRGVSFIKGSVIIGFEPKPTPEGGKPVVGAVILKDGTRVPADLVVVGVGIRPNTELFKGQLAMQPGGGLRVNAHLCSTSSSSVYVIGDAAAFPLPLYSNAVRCMEHVDHARKSAAVAVAEMMSQPQPTPPYDYLPYFYSRVFTLSWQFFGDNCGDCLLFGSWERKGEITSEIQEEVKEVREVKEAPLSKKFGAYFVDKGRLMGAFLEGGTKEEYGALAAVARMQPRVLDKKRLTELGTEWALREVRGVPGGMPGTAPRAEAAGMTTRGPGESSLSAGPGGQSSDGGALASSGNGMAIRRLQSMREGDPRPVEPAPQPPSFLTQASAGVVLAVGITVLAIWHGSYLRKRW